MRFYPFEKVLNKQSSLSLTLISIKLQVHVYQNDNFCRKNTRVFLENNDFKQCDNCTHSSGSAILIQLNISYQQTNENVKILNSVLEKENNGVRHAATQLTTK